MKVWWLGETPATNVTKGWWAVVDSGYSAHTGNVPINPSQEPIDARWLALRGRRAQLNRTIGYIKGGDRSVPEVRDWLAQELYFVEGMLIELEGGPKFVKPVLKPKSVNWVRCSSGKLAWLTKSHAELKLAKLAKKFGEERETRCYECKECGFWHLTSDPDPTPPWMRKEK